jgi:hypothetical protein
MQQGNVIFQKPSIHEEHMDGISTAISLRHHKIERSHKMLEGKPELVMTTLAIQPSSSLPTEQSSYLD